MSGTTTRTGVPYEVLAQTLFEEMERLYPEGDTWEDPSHDAKSVYRFCIVAVFEKADPEMEIDLAGVLRG